MGKQFESITPDLAAWLAQQRMFFVATAPLAGDGLVNCSPKGMDTFRVVGPKEVAYLDLTGSGIETTAHIRENGRIVFMFCAFTGPPKIVRLHGSGQVVSPAEPGFDALRRLFPEFPGTRSVIRAELHRISDSCGYAVPRYEYAGARDTLVGWADSKGPEGLAKYRAKKNQRSVDGLPGLMTES
jgi:hypothetical protein